MENYSLSELEIQRIADRAAENALRRAGLVKEQISTNGAYKRYGRKRVTEWRKRGLLRPIKQGNVIFWSLTELDKAAQKNLL